MTTPVLVVTGLLVRDRKVLMCERRPDKVYGLHWEFPGGKVEPGESLYDALVREIREELCVDVLSAQPFFRDTMTYSNGITYDVTFFLVTDFKGDLVNTEFESLGWFDVEGLKTLKHLSGNANIIERLLREGIPQQ